MFALHRPDVKNREKGALSSGEGGLKGFLCLRYKSNCLTGTAVLKPAGRAALQGNREELKYSLLTGTKVLALLVQKYLRCIRLPRSALGKSGRS